MSETVALDKKRQSKFARKVAKIKTKVQKGEIVVKDERPTRIVAPGEERGVVYVGHIPHGFYEEEMKDYFGQFGKVTQVRVCRSYKSGKSKGYGFVEFMHPEVAEVAADSMDNYVMFKRRLEVKNIAPEKQRPHLFKGSSWSDNNTPYQSKIKEITRARNQNVTPTEHKLKTKKRLKKVKSTLKKLADLGIEHKFQPIDLPVFRNGMEPLINQESDLDSSIEVTKKKQKAGAKKSKAIKKSPTLLADELDSSVEVAPKRERRSLMQKMTEVKPKALKSIKKQKDKVLEKKNKLKTKLSSDKLKKATMSILNNSNLVSKKSKPGKKMLMKKR